MKQHWPQRAYIGLYSGAGRARIKKTGEIVETTPTAVFRLPDPFTHHILVDKDPRCTRALTTRIEALGCSSVAKVMTGDVNDLVSDVCAALPPFDRDHGLISYCFVDPFGADLKFRTIEVLGHLRLDFLVLFASGHDIRRNFDHYLATTRDNRLADLLNYPQWRDEWREDQATKRSSKLVFVRRKFDQAMTSIGYRSVSPEDALAVKVSNRNVLLYDLVYYTKNPLGLKFWQETRKGMRPQMDMFS